MSVIDGLTDADVAAKDARIAEFPDL